MLMVLLLLDNINKEGCKRMLLSFNQAIELSDVKFMQEKKLTGKYFEEILVKRIKATPIFPFKF